jgi:3D (Asp-Asp-Asp) domain-containing protein
VNGIKVRKVSWPIRTETSLPFLEKGNNVMKTSKLSIALLTCLAFCLTLFYGLENQSRVNLLTTQINDLKGNFEAQERTSQEYIKEKEQAHEETVENLQKQIETLQQGQQALRERTEFLDRGGERGRIMEVTAYWEGSCGKKPDDPLYGITASGEYVQDGFVAAWLKEYPIGTRLYIRELDKVVTVMDCGGAITEGHLDIYMKDHNSCMVFGRQWLEVYRVE